jgi:hypothetical protein
MIDVQELRKWRYAEPFRPFELVLADGRQYLIKNPWNLGWSETSRQVMFASGPEDVDWARFDQVKELRPPQRRAVGAKKPTGRKRGRR